MHNCTQFNFLCLDSQGYALVTSSSAKALRPTHLLVLKKVRCLTTSLTVVLRNALAFWFLVQLNKPQ
jgi:hypothetical protein